MGSDRDNVVLSKQEIQAFLEIQAAAEGPEAAPKPRPAEARPVPREWPMWLRALWVANLVLVVVAASMLVVLAGRDWAALLTCAAAFGAAGFTLGALLTARRLGRR